MVTTQGSPRAAAATVASDRASYVGQVSLLLEITRGKTRFPVRPVVGPRFLIGSGITCDLRLGGEAMPALHSLIVIDRGEITLEAIVAEPPLVVNGRTVQNVSLRDGDVIRIGDVELLARLVAGTTPAGVQVPESIAPHDLPEKPLEELSAAELVDLIEKEHEQIEEFENQQRTGASALVQAVLNRRDRIVDRRGPELRGPHFSPRMSQILARRRQEESAPDAHTPEENPEFLRELELLGRQLTTLSQELKHSSQRANQRESSYASTATVLLETQQKLVSQLEVLLSQVQTLQEQQRAPVFKPRAIA